MFNPWVLLGILAAWASTLVGIWFYRGNIDAVAKDDAIKTMQVEADGRVQAAQKKAADEAKTMQSKSQGVTYALQSQLQKAAAALAAEHSTSQRLRDTVANFAHGDGGPGTAQLPFPEMQRRLSLISKLYTEALGDGAEASAAADAAGAKRDACEAWSWIVKPE